jgi:tetratricopeptide (TPR) repeat protein
MGDDIMRGTTSKTAFNLFREGVRVRVKPIDMERWAESEGFFRQAIEADTGTDVESAFAARMGFPRAWSWIAYGRALTWLEGWQDGKTEFLDSAVAFAGLGVERDPFDYDTHWVAAFVYLAAGDADRAETHRLEALDLVEEDHNPHLFNEMADILVWLGRADEAHQMLQTTRRITDWNRWSMAWSLYFKAQADPAFYEPALAEAESTFWQPGDERYEDDIQLLIAVITTQQAEMFDAINDPANAAQKRQRAETAYDTFKATTEDWTITKELHRMPFGPSAEAQAARDHWIDGLTKLGMPAG